MLFAVFLWDDRKRWNIAWELSSVPATLWETFSLEVTSHLLSKPPHPTIAGTLSSTYIAMYRCLTSFAFFPFSLSSTGCCASDVSPVFPKEFKGSFSLISFMSLSSHWSAMSLHLCVCVFFLLKRVSLISVLSQPHLLILQHQLSSSPPQVSCSAWKLTWKKRSCFFLLDQFPCLIPCAAAQMFMLAQVRGCCGNGKE